MCGVLFYLLYWILCTGTRGYNQFHCKLNSLELGLHVDKLGNHGEDTRGKNERL